tara:strand:+ start:197 stop:799 length:603 start_codon:yes stop_codon:yes gene_type:complete
MALKFANNNSLSAITSVPSGVGGGSLNLISTQTASSSSTISFTSGIDSTYKEYIFKFYNIHPSAEASFGINFSTDGGSNYNVAKTTTSFYAYNNEADSATTLSYRTAYDLAQGTGSSPLGGDTMSTSNDECGDGFLHLFDPSSTTFVKHFISRFTPHYPAYAMDGFTAGYGNTTSAIDAVQFAMSSGNIDAGTIKLYGVS